MADTFQVQLERLDGYRFRVDFDTPGVPGLPVSVKVVDGRGEALYTSPEG